MESLARGCAVITRPRGWLCQRAVPGVLITDSQHQASLCLIRLMPQPALVLRIGASRARYLQTQHCLHFMREQWIGLLTEVALR
jgi:hypothetical protein